MARRQRRRKPGRKGAAKRSGADQARRGLRVIAGRFKGSRLQTPPSMILRPMRDHVREALFSILGERVRDARVLDLFAGSGSLGLEALSREAAQALFVDRAPECLEAIRANVAHLRCEEQTRVLPYDLRGGPGGVAIYGPFDLLLVHPPFELFRPNPSQQLDVSELLQGLAADPRVCHPDTLIVFETPRACYPVEGSLPGLLWELRREYGSTALFVTRPRQPSVERPDPEEAGGASS